MTSGKAKAEEFVEDTYDIAVTGRNVQVTDAMKNYAIEKISKVDRFTQRVVDVNVTMDIQKLEHRVDIVTKVNNTTIKSSASSEDMYASIDKAVDKLIEQLRRHKTRMTDHHSIGHADIAMTVNVYRPSDDIADLNDAIEEANSRELIKKYKPHKVVHQETRPLKTYNSREAIIKMEQSGEHFMIFRGEEDLKIKVIYMREDGNFGIIEAEQ